MSNPIDFAAIPPLAGRYDLYGAVHKGLRKAQCDLLGRLGGQTSRAQFLSHLRQHLAITINVPV